MSQIIKSLKYFGFCSSLKVNSALNFTKKLTKQRRSAVSINEALVEHIVVRPESRHSLVNVALELGTLVTEVSADDLSGSSLGLSLVHVELASGVAIGIFGLNGVVSEQRVHQKIIRAGAEVGRDRSAVAQVVILVVSSKATVQGSQRRSILRLGSPGRLLGVGAESVHESAFLTELNLEVVVDFNLAKHALEDRRDLINCEIALVEQISMIPGSFEMLAAEFSVLGTSVAKVSLNDLGSSISSSVLSQEEVSIRSAIGIHGLNSEASDQ